LTVPSPASCSIHVPASSANLGPGFDSLAIALGLWMRVDVTVRGEDAPGALRDIGNTDLMGGANLVIEAMQVTAHRLGRPLPACDIRVESEIPVARGLGSSAAAIVGGVRAALFALGRAADEALVVDIAGSMEGHADNASASEMGGITVAVGTERGYIAESLASNLPWTAVVCIPDSPSLTHEARGVLPAMVPLADAAANVGRSALLALALREGRDDLLREAMADRLHQPYRAAIFPHLEPAISAALDSGALGACLSGAGPTILALAHPEDAPAVATAMQAAAERAGMTGQSRELCIAQGATTESDS
jgi:homoserine kinase